MPEKQSVIVVGPITSSGGIATVINTVINQPNLLEHYAITTVHTSQYKDSGILGELYTFLSGLFSYIIALFRDKPQIIHIHTSDKVSFFRKSIFGFIGWVFRKKVIFHIHSSNFYNFFYQPRNIFIRWYVRFIFRLADKVICLCFDWANCLQKSYNLENTRVISNPVLQNNTCKPKKRAGNITKILFMGFYIESKGIKDLLEVFKNIIATRKDIYLDICGKGKLNNYINQFIETNGLSTHIVNFGWVSGETKKAAFMNSDIFVLPSYKEGVPIAILEAFSYGLPVISTNISGIPEVITDNKNGYIIEPGDRDALHKAIIQLVDDKKLTEEMSENNLKHISLHSPQKIAQEWLSTYDELLSNTQHS